MTFLPVAQRELLAASRRRVTFRVRGAAGILAVLVGFLGLLGNGSGSGAGAPVFHFLAYLAAFVSAVAGLILTSDAIAAERREGTLGLLFLTDLTGADVLLGKLVAASAAAATALLAVFPVMAVGMILGGVTAGEFWRHTFALVNLLWVSVCVGLLASVSTRESGRSLVFGGMGLLLLTVGWPWLAAIVRQASLSPALDWLWSLSPVEAFSHADHGYFTTRPDRYWRALAVSHVVGWACLIVAAWWLPRAWQDRPAATTELASQSRREWRPLADEINPVARLARPTRRERLLVWTIAGVSLATAAGWVLTGNFGRTFPVWGSTWFSPAFLLLKGVFAWRCCVFFHGLRDGVGELLLTTPLREMQLIGGGWASARSMVQAPLIVLVIAYAVTGIVGGIVDHPGANGLVLAAAGNLVLPAMVVSSLVLDLVVLGWLSVRFGVTSGSPMAALGKALAVLFVPRIIFCVPDLVSAAVVLAWARGFMGRRYPSNMRADPKGGLRDAVRGG
jgi:ABC-type transport system involved in multi-copper enzyme maturation permease subunit